MSDLWAFQRGQMWAADMTSPTPPLIEARVPVEFSEIGEMEANVLEAVIERSAQPSVRSRLGTGRRCFGGWVQGQLAAYGWVSTGTEWIGELERHFQISPHEVYIWDCVTLREYRRKRLYTALLSFLLLQLRGEGAQRVWIGSNVENRPSIRGFQLAGFRPVAEFLYARALMVRSLKVKALSAAEPDLAEHLLLALQSAGERRLGEWVVGRQSFELKTP